MGDAPGDGVTATRVSPDGAFVGREGVMSVLASSLRDALAGQARTVLLVGEPGIGKTRTLHELAQRAAASDADIWLGRCLEDEGAPAFWPWMQVLRAGSRDRGAAELLALMGAGAADIAQAIPALREFLPDLPLSPQIERAHARFRFFDGMLAFLHNAAQQRPLVLLFDDLQRADQPTLRLLSFVSRQLDSARILIVGSCRPAAPQRTDGAFEWGVLAREMQSACLKLEGLLPLDVARLLEARAGSRAPGAVVDRLHQQTAGNPLFLQQILHTWSTSDEPAGAAHWQDLLSFQTEGLRGAIGRHLEALGEPCRELLRAAAVLGREFTAGDVAQMTEQSAEQVLELLSQATAAGVVRALTSGLQRHVFTHVLIRDALYDQLPAHARAMLHARAGMALEAHGPTHDQRMLAELAHHFVQAAPVYGEDKAVRYALRAAQAAQQCMGWEEAAVHFDRALQVCEALPSAAHQRLQLLLDKGEALIHASEQASARAALCEAAALARELRASDGLARAALLIARPPESGLVDWVQVDLLREALAALHGSDPRRPCLQALLAKALSYSRDLEARTSLALSALALARQVEDPELRAESLRHCHQALSEPHQLQERVAIADELARLGRERGDHRILLHATTAQIQNAMDQGDVPAVDLAIVTLERLVEQVREPYYRWYALVYRSMRQMLHGRFDEMERSALEARRVGVCFGADAAQHYFATQVAGPWRIQGRLSEVETMVSEIVARYPALSGWRALLAGVHADRGLRDRGKEVLEQIMREELSTMRTEPFALSAIAPLAELCAQVGTASQAATLYDSVLPYDGQWGAITYGISTYGPVARHLSMLAGRAGDLPTAERHFEDALAQVEQVNAPSFICITLIAHARMVMRNQAPDARERAAAMLGRTLQLSRHHGFHGLSAFCEGFAMHAKLSLLPQAAQ
jgi:hypothetical protein